MREVIKIKFANNQFFGEKSIEDICRAFKIPGCTNFFPFFEKELFIPKPALISDKLLNLSLSDHKYHRIMKYLSITDIFDFFYGVYPFGKKSHFTFGEFIFQDDEMVYRFNDNCGIYAPIINEDLFKSTENNIIEIISCMVEKSNAIEVEFDYMDEVIDCGGNNHIFILMNDLDTTKYSERQLEELLRNASFNISYCNNKFVLIHAGACFENCPEWLKEAFMLEILL